MKCKYCNKRLTKLIEQDYHSLCSKCYPIWKKGRESVREDIKRLLQELINGL